MSFREAAVAWALAAHAELAETATGYGHFITVNELAERIQEVSGVHTEAPTRTWMAAILRKVARRCHSAGEPPLTALCVRQNHTVGNDYKYVLELAGLPIPEDLELHAAYARWQCYQHYGAEMPAEVGVPPLTPKVDARRRGRSAAKPTTAVKEDTTAEPRAAVCSQCFIQLPAGGVCEYCL
ncbi:hypothetical protein HGA08_02700 [Nocardia vermiculata]|uniref:Uncharacterized protein n=1 Tax=Nocardia vermiculata TaxID=257274 RepID=A0A846XY18_9NOCA|nr:hypothetical protein [Nocardia vermiculata]